MSQQIEDTYIARAVGMLDGGIAALGEIRQQLLDGEVDASLAPRDVQEKLYAYVQRSL